MNAETISTLCRINNDFYRNQCASFSDTRSYPWPGWQRCLEVLADDCPDVWHNDGSAQHVGRDGFSVLDVACGNLRFETFLAGAFPQTDIAFYAVDNCDDLVSEQPAVQYQSLDVMQVLRGEQASGNSLGEALAAPACDLVVSFGFMHHVPSVRYREEVLASLVNKTLPGGYVAVSFWQFLNNDSLAEKAHAVHAQALEELALSGLEDGDYLLGWKNTPGAYRYCHHFTEEEIEQLAASVANTAHVVARFRADGRTGDLNSYLVLKVS